MTPAGPVYRFNSHSSGPGTCLHPSRTQGAKGRRLSLSRASQAPQGTASRQPQAQPGPGPARPRPQATGPATRPAGSQPSGAPPRGQSGGLGKAQRQCLVNISCHHFSLSVRCTPLTIIHAHAQRLTLMSIHNGAGFGLATPQRCRKECSMNPALLAWSDSQLQLQA